jgi:hypothetical protein
MARPLQPGQLLQVSVHSRAAVGYLSGPMRNRSELLTDASALGGCLGRTMIHRAGAVMVDRGAFRGPLFLRVERALDIIDGVTDRVHGPPDSLDGLGGDRPLDCAAWMSGAPYTARD